MSIESLLNQTANIYTKTGYNKYGRDAESGSATQVQCRFQNKTKTKMGANGQTVMLLGIIYFTGDTVVNVEDRVLIGGVSYKVFSVDGSIDDAGDQRLIKCEVQKWQI